MNCLKVTFFLVALLIPSISLSLEANSNYPLYSLDNVVAYELSHDARSLFTIERTDGGSVFVSRNLETGKVTQTVSLLLPSVFFMNTVINGENIYVFCVDILDREKELLETTIIRIDTKNGQEDIIYKSEDSLGFAERFYATDNGLLLTEKRGNNPYLFNLKTNVMVPVELDDDFRVRSFDLEKNSAIIVEQSNFSTNYKSSDANTTYTEGEGNLLNVYLCDFTNEFKLTKVGQYQPSYVLSKNEEESFLPHFIIENDDYAWVGHSFMINRFPIYPGALIGDSYLYSMWESLFGYDLINEIDFVGTGHVVAKQFSEIGEPSLVVFDILNPNLTKPETISKIDRDRIENLFRQKATTEKSALDPTVLSKVFAARFYKVSLVTTEVDSSDGGVSTFTSRESFTAVAKDNNYSVFKRTEELTSLVCDDFVLDEQSAVVFQDALDVLFPMGHFAQKHKMFYGENEKWIFVRDESFGAKVGIIVDVDDGGKVIRIGAEQAISIED